MFIFRTFLVLCLVFSLSERLSTASAQETKPSPEEAALLPNSPKALPQALRDRITKLNEETTTLRSRDIEATEALPRAQQELRELEIEAASLKAFLAVQSLPLPDVERQLRTYENRQVKVKAVIKALEEEIEKTRTIKGNLTTALATLEDEMKKLRESKVQDAWTNDIEEAYQAYQKAAALEQRFATHMIDMLQSTWLVLQEQDKTLESVLRELRSLVETWRVELLKRQEALPFQEQIAQIWNSFMSLPNRAYQWASAFIRLGRTQSLVADHSALLMGLLAFIVLLRWASRHVNRLAASRFRAWDEELQDDGMRFLLRLGEVLLSLMFPMGLILGIGLTLHTLGMLDKGPALITIYSLAAVVLLRFLRRIITVFFGAKHQKGILLLDDETARHYRRTLRRAASFLILGILGLQIIRILDFPSSTRQFLRYLFEVSLLVWTLFLLRERHMERLIPFLSGPAWFFNLRITRAVSTLVAILLVLMVLPYLMGFQSLSIYIAQAAVKTEGILILWLLLRLAGHEILCFWLHGETGWLAYRYASRAELLRRLCALARQAYDVVLAILGVLAVLAAWGLKPQILLLAFQWLRWGIDIGPVRLTPINIAMTILVIGFVLWFSKFVSTLLQVRIFPRTGWDIGIQYTISAILRYVILIVGGLLAMTVLGFPLANLALIMGALGVGVGLGLQSIVSNFVSGLVLLIERPIKVGDMLVIDGQWGEVKQIRMRSTVFQTVDRSVLIIPNSDLTTNKIVNWTHFGRGPSRITLTVGVSYNADVREVTQILSSVCKANPRVTDDPEPTIFFRAYGESSLEFTIYAYVYMPSDRVPATHEMNTAIFEAFKEHGIEIPFPQRELHIKNWPEELSVKG